MTRSTNEKDQKAWVSRPDTIRVSFALVHTYLLSDGKVATILVDIVIKVDEIARGDVPLRSQTAARRTRGSGVERARG